MRLLLRFGILMSFFWAALETSVAAQETQRFLNGFPDVPHLDIIASLQDDPVVFDTNSGTVAETVIEFSVPVEDAIKTYGEALAGLGWTCSKVALQLTCVREDMMVQFKPPEVVPNTPTLILRLEPRQ